MIDEPAVADWNEERSRALGVEVQSSAHFRQSRLERTETARACLLATPLARDRERLRRKLFLEQMDAVEDLLGSQPVKRCCKARAELFWLLQVGTTVFLQGYFFPPPNLDCWIVAGDGLDFRSPRSQHAYVHSDFLLRCCFRSR